MSFTATPTDGSSTPIPMSSVVPDGTNTPTALEGGPSLSSGGNTLAPASMYVKDGNDVTQGVTTDAAVTSDTSGTISGKLRGLVKIFADVWDSVNHRIKVDGSGVTQPVTQPYLNSDGLQNAQELFASNAGGPIISTGVSSNYNYSRLKTGTGAAATNFTILSTTGGDTHLTANPATTLPLRPGQYIEIKNPGERVYIADSFIPSASTTTIPLRSPVVSGGQVTAWVETFDPFGGALNPKLQEGVLPSQLCLTDPLGFLYPITTAANSPTNPNNAFPSMPFVFDPDFGTASQLQANYHFASVPSQSLTGSGLKGNALAARTFRGCIIYINITAIGTGSVTVSLFGYDWNIGQSANYLVLASTAFVGNGFHVLKVYPGLTASNNLVANDVLPPLSYIQIDGANGTTMQVDMALIA